MAFTELSTVTSVPGQVVILYGATLTHKNYLIQNIDLVPDTIQPWGYAIASIYVPTPVDRYAALYTRPCYNDSEFVFNLLPEFPELNIQWSIYATRNDQSADIRLWVE